MSIKMLASLISCVMLSSMLVLAEDDPRAILFEASHTKLASLAFRMGHKTQLKSSVAFSFSLKEHKAVYAVPYTFTDDTGGYRTVVLLHDYISKGGRAVIWLGYEQQGLRVAKSREQFQELFSMSFADEGNRQQWTPYSRSVFSCLPFWQGTLLSLSEETKFPIYLVPGSSYARTCSITNPIAQKDRCVAAEGQVGLGKVLFLVAPSAAGTLLPLDDHLFDLGDNEAAGRKLIQWLTEP